MGRMMSELYKEAQISYILAHMLRYGETTMSGKHKDIDETEAHVFLDDVPVRIVRQELAGDRISSTEETFIKNGCSLWSVDSSDYSFYIRVLDKVGEVWAVKMEDLSEKHLETIIHILTTQK